MGTAKEPFQVLDSADVKPIRHDIVCDSLFDRDLAILIGLKGDADIPRMERFIKKKIL